MLGHTEPVEAWPTAEIHKCNDFEKRI